MNLSKVYTFVRNAVVICHRTPYINVSAVATCKRSIHTTKPNYDLMEFFDDKKHWGQSTVKVGRGWKLDELRLKSNTDLHKLWYVLLKERNMLYTMKHECNEETRLFPNPERIDKVQDSMSNIETVVRERNIAYYKLETGETGERPVEDIMNLIGLPEKYKKKEYIMPKFMNTKWVKNYIDHGFISSYAVRKFIKYYKEKQYNEERKARNRQYNHVQQLLKRFPNMDLDKLRAEFPNVDIEKAMRTRKARGHCMPKY